MSLEELDDILFQLDSCIVEQTLLEKLENALNDIGLIRLWEDGYTRIVKFILINVYKFDSYHNIEYLERFIRLHYNNEFKNDDFVDYVDYIPYIYVRKTTRKNMKRHINKYNICNENSKMLKEYFEYNK